MVVLQSVSVAHLEVRDKSRFPDLLLYLKTTNLLRMAPSIACSTETIIHCRKYLQVATGIYLILQDNHLSTSW